MDITYGQFSVRKQFHHFFAHSCASREVLVFGFSQVGDNCLSVAIEIMHSKSYFIVKYKEYIIFKLRFELIFAKYS